LYTISVQVEKKKEEERRKKKERNRKKEKEERKKGKKRKEERKKRKRKRKDEEEEKNKTGYETVVPDRPRGDARISDSCRERAQRSAVSQPQWTGDPFSASSALSAVT